MATNARRTSLNKIAITHLIDHQPWVVDSATLLADMVETWTDECAYAVVMQAHQICGIVTSQMLIRLTAASTPLNRQAAIGTIAQSVEVVSEDQLDWDVLFSLSEGEGLPYLLIVDAQGQLVGVITQEKVTAIAKILADVADPMESAARLEQLVQQRTRELTQKNLLLQQEVSERQKISAALQDSENKFSGIVSVADDAIISIDEQQNIQLFNRGAERIFGYSPEEIIGQPLDILLPEAFRLIHRKHVQSFSEMRPVSRRMGERNSQVFGLRKDGSKFPAEASISKLKTQTGYLFTVILKDISVQHHSQIALQRSEAQLRLITNALPVLISYIDEHQRYQFTNYAYENWFGIPHQRLKNTYLRDILGAVTYQTLQPYLEEALLGKQVTFEMEFPHQNGTNPWVRISYIPDIEVNRVKGCFCLVSDISDHKAAEQLKDDFVSVVSHELRTPLTSVHGSLKLLTTGQLGLLNGQGRDLLEIALKNTERLTRLINDVLDLERIESGRITMAKEKCSALKLVQQAIEAMQSMACECGITLINEATSVFVWADPDHIEQTLTNLLSNAIKYSPKGSLVHLSTQDRGEFVLFKVKDRGRGIPEASLETIFERFKQVDASDSRKRGGTGLGLAICREIVQQHGGRIWVTSLHSQGSTFCFTLPKENLAKL